MPHLGPTELLIIVGVVVLLFGGRKLPELARGTGQALRIFKSEVTQPDELPAKADTRSATDVDPITADVVVEPTTQRS
ncbi:twin-arginine translocase TatA/TatE family subunit [Aeromicrobium duanguangcaii]|uniref:Sec-independent protein translocase protein TatA n=1 Tax=Aeromicrobium duanguangcaii TaxID=2968086 RepID=A0ABY5KDI3_9ACTN|nr:twin-arginine translocase TatA/TatE family subunit [Aeromicrobium duanguangcaii]MCD9155374.1 twin-arginine translocase TatA/TatE family subunit [Aeromicrobium duanguangcaii]MCL3838342.1 twin-arginine translocase TatA/TatE family subunit [Aeromicrobium duanguangcaii]UUI68354.1 twin-arginine translocase TatA/TatE family subunit [Aeromicrobium duanguangcaii]